jgi:predicted  nucleic acid-binding Zn-ribbon protein
VLPALASLIALQALDTKAEAARRRLAELPVAIQQGERAVADAVAVVDAAKRELAANTEARRELEKQVAVVDGRLARFDDHKAAVKTNQEFTALLHEIEVAREGKDKLEDQILALLEEADRISAAIGEAQGALTRVEAEAEAARQVIDAERVQLERELEQLAAERAREGTGVEPAVIARYEQLLKQRRMVAVAPLEGDVCGACHVKLRPVVAQHVRHNEEIVSCDSCQRILYAPARPETDGDTTPPPT